MQIDQQTIQAAISNLPPIIADAIYNEETLQKIRDIGKKNNLHIDQIGEIEDEVGLYIAGMTDRKELPVQIQYIVRDQEKTNTIIADIDQLILAPLREKIKEFTKEKGGVEAALGQPLSIPSQPNQSLTVPTRTFSKLEAPVRASVTETKIHDTPLSEGMPQSSTPGSTEPQKAKVDPYREPIE